MKKSFNPSNEAPKARRLYNDKDMKNLLGPRLTNLLSICDPYVGATSKTEPLYKWVADVCCVICGNKDPKGLEAAHIVAKEDLGLKGIDNIVFLCKSTKSSENMSCHGMLDTGHFSANIIHNAMYKWLNGDIEPLLQKEVEVDGREAALKNFVNDDRFKNIFIRQDDFKTDPFFLWYFNGYNQLGLSSQYRSQIGKTGKTGNKIEKIEYPGINELIAEWPSTGNILKTILRARADRRAADFKRVKTARDMLDLLRPNAEKWKGNNRKLLPLYWYELGYSQWMLDDVEGARNSFQNSESYASENKDSLASLEKIISVATLNILGLADNREPEYQLGLLKNLVDQLRTTFYVDEHWQNAFAGSWYTNIKLNIARLELQLGRLKEAAGTIREIDLNRVGQDISTGLVKESRAGILAIKGAYFIDKAAALKKKKKVEWEETALLGTKYLGRSFRNFRSKVISLQGMPYVVKKLSQGLYLLGKTPEYCEQLKEKCLLIQ